MDRYVGLDAHPTSCTLAVMGPSGKRLKSMVVETNGAALVETVKSIPGRVHLCLEEGTQSAWLHELLSPHVAELVVAVAPENKGPKDDLRDAWARANELRTGSIKTRVYKAPLHLAALRNAVRGYGFAVRDAVRAMNRLRSVFLSRGVAVNDGIYNAKGRVRWLSKLTSPHRRLAEWLGNWTSLCRCERKPRSGCSRRRRRIRSFGLWPRRPEWDRSAPRRWWRSRRTRTASALGGSTGATAGSGS